MPSYPPCAPGEPPHNPDGPGSPDDDEDDSSYPIAIGLRRSVNNGQFRPKRPGDPQPGLFDNPN